MITAGVYTDLGFSNIFLPQHSPSTFGGWIGYLYIFCSLSAPSTSHLFVDQKEISSPTTLQLESTAAPDAWPAPGRAATWPRPPPRPPGCGPGAGPKPPAQSAGGRDPPATAPRLEAFGAVPRRSCLGRHPLRPDLGWRNSGAFGCWVLWKALGCWFAKIWTTWTES